MIRLLYPRAWQVTHKILWSIHKTYWKNVCLCVQMFIHRDMLCRCTTLFQLNLVIDLGNCLYYIVLHFEWRSMHTQWSPAKDRSISYAPTFWEIFGGKHQVHTSSWIFKVCPNPLWWEGSKTWFSKPHVWLPNSINILSSFYFQEH